MSIHLNPPRQLQVDDEISLEYKDFRSLVKAAQWPDPTDVIVQDETNDLGTVLLEAGLMTEVQAMSSATGRAFDEMGHEAEEYPDPMGLLTFLGLPLEKVPEHVRPTGNWMFTCFLNGDDTVPVDIPVDNRDLETDNDAVEKAARRYLAARGRSYIGHLVVSRRRV